MKWTFHTIGCSYGYDDLIRSCLLEAPPETDRKFSRFLLGCVDGAELDLDSEVPWDSEEKLFKRMLEDRR